MATQPSVQNRTPAVGTYLASANQNDPVFILYQITGHRLSVREVPSDKFFINRVRDEVTYEMEFVDIVDNYASILYDWELKADYRFDRNDRNSPWVLRGKDE